MRKGIPLSDADCIAALNAHCFENLSKQECSKHFPFMNELPRTIISKLQKRDLKTYFSEYDALPLDKKCRFDIVQGVLS